MFNAHDIVFSSTSHVLCGEGGLGVITSHLLLENMTCNIKANVGFPCVFIVFPCGVRNARDGCSSLGCSSLMEELVGLHDELLCFATSIINFCEISTGILIIYG